MSIRFTIKDIQEPAQKDSDGSIIRYSGASEPYRQSSERSARVVKVDKDRNPIEWEFTTGLDEKKTQFMPWYNDEERKEVAKSIKELRKVVEEYYGESTLEPGNYAFWKMDNNINRLSLNQNTLDVFYDTEKPAHALLYLSIIAGAFVDVVAPTKDWARQKQIRHYMALDTEDAPVNISGFTKSEAHAALGDLRKNADPEALFILAWCMQYDTKSFAAYSRSIPFNQLVNYHIQYIEGQLVTKKKRDTAKNFLDYYNKWIGQQTRSLLYAEAYVKAGEWFNFLPRREKKLTTPDGTILGVTIEEAVSKITKPARIDDLEKLKEQVEAKWKE